MVWPRTVQVGGIYGAGKDESETAPKPCSSSSCSFARCPPGYPNFCSFTQLVFFTLCWVSVSGGHAGEGLWWPWWCQGGARAGAALPPAPRGLSQTKTLQVQGTESRASSVAVPLSPWVCVPCAAAGAGLPGGFGDVCPVQDGLGWPGALTWVWWFGVSPQPFPLCPGHSGVQLLPVCPGCVLLSFPSPRSHR